MKEMASKLSKITADLKKKKKPSGMPKSRYARGGVVSYMEKQAEAIVKHYFPDATPNEVFSGDPMVNLGDYRVDNDQEGDGSKNVFIEVYAGEDYAAVNDNITKDYNKYASFLEEIANNKGFDAEVLTNDEDSLVIFKFINPRTSRYAGGGTTSEDWSFLKDKTTAQLEKELSLGRTQLEAIGTKYGKKETDVEKYPANIRRSYNQVTKRIKVIESELFKRRDKSFNKNQKQPDMKKGQSSNSNVYPGLLRGKLVVVDATSNTPWANEKFKDIDELERFTTDNKLNLISIVPVIWDKEETPDGRPLFKYSVLDEGENFINFLAKKGYKKYYVSQKPIERYEQAGSKRLTKKQYADLEKEFDHKKRFAKGGNISEVELPNTNLLLRGIGMDTNGNKIVKLSFYDGTKFSMQTNNAGLNTVHRLSKSEKLSDISEEELDKIAKEISVYIKEHGTSTQKKKLSTYAEGGKTKGKVKLVVADEKLLGYIDPISPTNIGVLHGSILKGYSGPQFGSYPVSMTSKIRLASEKDFHDFRVSFKGFDNENEYEYDKTKYAKGGVAFDRDRYNELIIEYDMVGEQLDDEEDSDKKQKLRERLSQIGDDIHAMEHADDAFTEGGTLHNYRLGDKYREDFDTDGMFALAEKAKISWGYEKLRKLYDSMESMNYHTDAMPLWQALEYLRQDDIENAEKAMKEFHAGLGVNNDMGIQLQDSDIPDDVFDALYATDRRLTDTTISVVKKGDGVFEITSPDNGFAIIERGDGMDSKEQDIYKFLDKTFNDRLGFADGGRVKPEDKHARKVLMIHVKDVNYGKIPDRFKAMSNDDIEKYLRAIGYYKAYDCGGEVAHVEGQAHHFHNGDVFLDTLPDGQTYLTIGDKVHVLADIGKLDEILNKIVETNNPQSYKDYLVGLSADGTFEYAFDLNKKDQSENTTDMQNQTPASELPARIAISDARVYAENLLPFKGSGLEGKTLDNGDYVVLALQFYPVWYFDTKNKKWYENTDKLNSVAAFQQSHSRPTYSAEQVSMPQLFAKMGEGIERYDLGGLMVQQLFPMTTDNTYQAHAGAANTEL